MRYENIIRFEQIWFAGNHADVGGGYAENESRLSDITLHWIVSCAKLAGLIVNEDLLQLKPDPLGPQHDEVKAGFSFFGGGLLRKLRFTWKAKDRSIPSNADLDKSVIARFECVDGVLQYDKTDPYRPVPLKTHEVVGKFY